jgi:hypothetical protein
VTLERSDRDGLRLQVHAGPRPADRRKRWVTRPVPDKGRAALKRAKQVEAELLVRVAAGSGDIDRPMCRATPRSRSRPAGAATLDTFYVRLRKEGGRAGRSLATE